MKKKLMAMFMALAVLVTGSFIVPVDVHAEDIGEVVDISDIMTEDALIGYATMQTRGIYLTEGVSVLNDAGGGKIGAGGITEAAIRCQVSVNVIVERKVNGSWVRVTSWSATKTNALTVGTAKEISVASGYWYRVRCTHSAASDVTNSYTGALWM